MKRVEESFEEIKDESFYTSPPYSYRPSVAEYLTSFNVTKKSFIADILHLDFKKKIKVISFEEDHLVIELKDASNLTNSEILIWNYLYKLKKDPLKEVVTFCPKKIPFIVMLRFKELVRMEESERFGKYDLSHSSQPIQGIKKIEDVYNVKVIEMYLRSFSFGVFGYFFGVFFFPIVLILSLVKIKNQRGEGYFLIKRFLFKFFGIYFIGWGLMIFSFILFIILASIFSLGNPLIFSSFLIPLIIFVKYCRLSLDFVMWITEKPEATKNREEWSKFKLFIKDNSAIEDKPLAHYKLWGPFYYYALSLGVVKDPYKIR
jgi:hypothetical protein